MIYSQVSAIRRQVQVFSTRCRFGPVPVPEHPHPIPDCWDLRPEEVFFLPPATRNVVTTVSASQPFTMPADPLEGSAFTHFIR